MSLLCVLIDVVGRFVAHFMGIVFAARPPTGVAVSALG